MDTSEHVSLELKASWGQADDLLTSTKPLVSICMPHAGRVEYLDEALESLCAQDYPNVEIIVALTKGGKGDQADSHHILSFWQSRRRCEHTLRVALMPVQESPTNQESVSDLPTDKLRNLAAAEGKCVRFILGNVSIGCMPNHVRGVGAAKGDFVLFFDDDDVAMVHMVRTYLHAALLTGADILTDLAVQVHDTMYSDGEASELGVGQCSRSKCATGNQPRRCQLVWSDTADGVPELLWIGQSLHEGQCFCQPEREYDLVQPPELPVLTPPLRGLGLLAQGRLPLSNGLGLLHGLSPTVRAYTAPQASLQCLNILIIPVPLYFYRYHAKGSITRGAFEGADTTRESSVEGYTVLRKLNGRAGTCTCRLRESCAILCIGLSV
eukprot:scaffold30_cov416-Prasinococcus_capsulatus_cf.AAC.19